jgi:hypothetical protein
MSGHPPIQFAPGYDEDALEAYQDQAFKEARELRAEDDRFDLWLRSDEPVKLEPDELRRFQERLSTLIHARVDAGGHVRRIAACLRDSFADGLDEGTSMHIARRIAALGTATPAAEDGYQMAFYELAGLLNIGARAQAPMHVWRNEMMPRVLAAVEFFDANRVAPCPHPRTPRTAR